MRPEFEGTLFCSEKCNYIKINPDALLDDTGLYQDAFWDDTGLYQDAFWDDTSFTSGCILG